MYMIYSVKNGLLVRQVRPRMSIFLSLLGLLVYYSAKTSRHRQNGLSYVPKKILTWMFREARGGFKATVDNRVKPDYHFIRIVFCYFLFVSARSVVYPGRLCLKSCQYILDIVGLSQAEV